jgi:hypothetical protein
MTRKEAADQLAILVAEMRLALDESDPDCPTWPDQLLVIADALDPSGFADESAAVSRTDTRYKDDAEALAIQRDDLRARLYRIYAAAISDADLAGMAVRDFLVRESEVAALPDVIVGLTPGEADRG